MNQRAVFYFLFVVHAISSAGFCVESSKTTVIRRLCDLDQQGTFRADSMGVKENSGSYGSGKQDNYAFALKVEGELRGFLVERYNMDIELKLDKVPFLPGELHLEDYNFTFENEEINENRTHIHVDLVFSDPAQSRIRIHAQIDCFDKVPVLVRPVTRGETITEGDIEWKRIRCNKIRSGIITDIKDVAGFQSRRSMLPARVPLQRCDLVREQAVRKGSIVILTLETKGINIRMHAKALDDGASGDMIRVSNMDSGKILKAVVECQGAVRIPLIDSAVKESKGGVL